MIYWKFLDVVPNDIFISDIVIRCFIWRSVWEHDTVIVRFIRMRGRGNTNYSMVVFSCVEGTVVETTGLEKVLFTLVAVPPVLFLKFLRKRCMYIPPTTTTMKSTTATPIATQVPTLCADSDCPGGKLN